MTKLLEQPGSLHLEHPALKTWSTGIYKKKISLIFVSFLAFLDPDSVVLSRFRTDRIRILDSDVLWPKTEKMTKLLEQPLSLHREHLSFKNIFFSLFFGVIFGLSWSRSGNQICCRIDSDPLEFFLNTGACFSDGKAMQCGKTSDLELASDDDVNRPLLGRAWCFFFVLFSWTSSLYFWSQYQGC